MIPASSSLHPVSSACKPKTANKPSMPGGTTGTLKLPALKQQRQELVADMEAIVKKYLTDEEERSIREVEAAAAVLKPRERDDVRIRLQAEREDDRNQLAIAMQRHERDMRKVDRALQKAASHAKQPPKSIKDISNKLGLIRLMVSHPSTEMEICPRCGQQYQAKYKKWHDTEDCPDRPVKCPGSGCEELIRPSERERHQAVCRAMQRREKMLARQKSRQQPLPCPMCGEMMQVRELRKHEKETCKYRMIACRHPDCNAMIRACDVPKHENTTCKSTWCKLRRKLKQKERQKWEEAHKKELEAAAAAVGMTMDEYHKMRSILDTAFGSN